MLFILLFEQYLEKPNESNRQQLTFQVIQLLFVRRVQKTLQTSILPTQNWLDRLLVHFFVLLSAPSAEHRKVLLISEKDKKTLNYKSRFVLVS